MKQTIQVLLQKATTELKELQLFETCRPLRYYHAYISHTIPHYLEILEAVIRMNPPADKLSLIEALIEQLKKLQFRLTLNGCHE